MKLFKRVANKKRQPKFRNTEVNDQRVFSYRSKSQGLQNKQIPGRLSGAERVGKNQSKKAHWHKLPSYLILATILVSLGYSFSLDTNPKIVTIEARSDSSLLRSKLDYQNRARSLLESSFLNRSKITINTAAFNSAMKLYFPELSDVAVTLPLAGRRPIVEIAAKQPQIILSSPEGSDFIIDSDGRAVMKASSAVGLDSLHLPVVKDKNNTKIELGKRIITRDDVTFITTVVKQLKAKNLTEKSISLPSIPSEMHLQVNNTNYFIKFNLQGDASLQIGAFLAAKKKFDIENIIPSEYVDVRVEERVYYK